MIREAIDRVLGLAVPNYHTSNELEYSDKTLSLIVPPIPAAVACSTLQGLADLHNAEMDDAKKEGDLLVHVTSPTGVQLISRESDKWGRRRVWAMATYPECKSFQFGAWMDPESFIIAAQQGFQRVKIENEDGTLAQDLDYVLGVASKISAESAVQNDDDGISQRVTMRSGITLKAEKVLRPLVNLAPYRTFAEIDQPITSFVFRARVGSGGGIHLAIFEGDGGRWKLGAVAAIAAWLKERFQDVAVIS